MSSNDSKLRTVPLKRFIWRTVRQWQHTRECNFNYYTSVSRWNTPAAPQRTLLTGHSSPAAPQRTLFTGHSSPAAPHRTLLTGSSSPDTPHRTLIPLVMVYYESISHFKITATWFTNIAQVRVHGTRQQLWRCQNTFSTALSLSSHGILIDLTFFLILYFLICSPIIYHITER